MAGTDGLTAKKVLRKNYIKALDKKGERIYTISIRIAGQAGGRKAG